MKAISINVGVNDPPSRCGTTGVLKHAEDSARNLEERAEDIGFAIEDPAKKVKLGALVGADATAPNVLSALDFARFNLDPGGILLLSFSGHGCQVRDSPPYDERDHMDETWCLADRKLRDDEVMEKLRLFDDGIRILVIADSCHSGGGPGMLSVTREEFLYASELITEAESRVQRWVTRPECFAKKKSIPRLGLKTSVLLLASCPEDRTCEDGIFSWALECSLDQGNPQNYCELRDQIHRRLSLLSAFPPELKPFGVLNPGFYLQKPFEI